MDLLPTIASILAAKAMENIGVKLSESTIEALNSLVETTFKKLKEKKNTQTRALIASVEQGNPKDLPEQSLEIIAESIEEEMNENPEFAKEFQEKTKHLLEQISAEDPDIAEEIHIKTKDLLNRLQKFQEDLNDIRNKIDNISANIPSADFVGRDDTLFSGVPTIYQYHFYGSENQVQINPQEGIFSSKENNGFRTDDFVNTNIDEIFTQIERIRKQIERLRSAITKIIPVEKRLEKLEKLRQPKPIFNYNAFVKFTKDFLYIFVLVFQGLILGFLGVTNLFEKRKNKDVEKSILLDEDLIKLETVEEYLASAIEKEKRNSLQYVKENLSRLVDKVNVRIAITNDLFISLIYPASSSKELVANMASRIGHKDLRDEAEMHLGIISRLVEKLNKITEKLDIERLTDSKENKINNSESDSVKILKAIVNNLDADSLKNFTSIMKSLVDKPQEKSKEHAKEDEEKKDESIYVLSDEAQAAVGIMTEIEERRLIVEKLVRSDRVRQNFTIMVVTIYIGAVIILTIRAYLQFGSNSKFIVGNDLGQTKLAFLGIPWPVVIWSLIGSFAAMIYRFNRQPIYDFTDAIKWMLTRPTQGVVLGSAFYLVLASGLFLLTGGASGSTSSGVGKVTTEIILVLSFLVGFSDKFADSVFNALVDKYSGKEPKSTEDTKDSDRSKKYD
ncbi:hypothetical protein NSTC745_02406 [Nostoc sp. DSM 114161]|uniref:hypothetical protein n=1 Tax=Nostoc sp. DSM 114161 TaxID=3440143 RepID=UPI0040466EDA